MFIRNVSTGEHNLPTVVVIAALVAAIVFVALVGG